MKDVIMTKSPTEIEADTLAMLRIRYNSLVDAVKAVQADNDKFRSYIDVMERKLIHAQENVDINKKIVMDSILGQNKMKDEFAIEINLLSAKLKKAKEALT